MDNKYQEAKRIMKLYDYSTRLELSEEINNNVLDNLSVKDFMYMKEIVLELLDRAIPKKPEQEDDDFYCPNCKLLTESSYFIKESYCTHCGQALDWSKK